ncbi:MAG: DUF2793 domain-containing protein [Xanthobacteraceae bacterium]
MTDTINLGLPFIDGNQAQKHVTHNEALRILDAAIQIAVADTTRTVPPASPATGNRHVVANGAGGAWTGHDGDIATWEDGAWAFLAPKAGWWLWSVADASIMIFDGAAWRAFAPPADNVSRLGVNTTASEPNLLSVKSNAALLAAIEAADGGSGDARLQISKETAAGTASVFFSDDYSGRAEFGLTGDDDFHLKVSPDGVTWQDAFVIDGTTGEVAFKGFTDAGATRAALGADVLAGFRNRIINGGFEIWQRAKSKSIAAGASAYVADRWLITNSTDQPVTISRQAVTPGQTDIPGNPGSMLRAAFASAPTSGLLRIAQRAEGVLTLAGQTASARAYLSGPSGSETLAYEAIQNFGTGGSPSSPIATFAASLDIATIHDPSTMLRRARFSVPSVSGKTLGANGDDYLELAWLLSPRQSGNYEMSRASLVEGDAFHEIDPFSPRHIAQELALCQRYYEQCTSNDTSGAFPGCIDASGSATGAGLTLRNQVQFNVEKRVIPTIMGTTRASNAVGALTYGGGTRAVYGQANTTGAAVNVYFTAYWTADAEF